MINSFSIRVIGFMLSLFLFYNSLSYLVLSPRLISPCSEEAPVKEVVLGYITNFFLNDYDQMEGYLHDRLSKRGVNSDGQISQEYPKDAIKELMENKPALPSELQKNDILEVNVYTNIATVIMETGYPNTRWKEYIHLAKVNGKWVIMDVLWDFEIKQ